MLLLRVALHGYARRFLTTNESIRIAKKRLKAQGSFNARYWPNAGRVGIDLHVSGVELTISSNVMYPEQQLTDIIAVGRKISRSLCRIENLKKIASIVRLSTNTTFRMENDFRSRSLKFRR
ncbi:hypothetical protein VTN77DRAFT_1501 [Rasamsonia byssochlamydoides]|uniref:uncharacterized protein n=1 Tax=Rasamsonia byssochlamydoides TaxID=89139 RepID=UPI003743F5E8